LLPRKSAEIYRSIDELAVIAAQGQGAGRA
jgi:hypothetical protein